MSVSAAVEGDFRQMVFPAILEVSADTNIGILSRFGACLEELAIKTSEEGKEEGKCCTQCCKGQCNVPFWPNSCSVLPCSQKSSDALIRRWHC